MIPIVSDSKYRQFTIYISESGSEHGNPGGILWILTIFRNAEKQSNMIHKPRQACIRHSYYLTEKFFSGLPVIIMKYARNYTYLEFEV